MLWTRVFWFLVLFSKGMIMLAFEKGLGNFPCLKGMMKCWKYLKPKELLKRFIEVTAIAVQPWRAATWKGPAKTLNLICQHHIFKM